MKIKRFIGRNENAVLIQVLTAMIAYLLLKLVQLNGQSAFSLKQIGRLIGVNLTSRRCIVALLHPQHPDLGRPSETLDDATQWQFDYA